MELGQAAKRLKIRRDDLDRLVRGKIAERAKHLRVVDFPDDARVSTNDVYQVIAGRMVYNKPTKDGPIPVYLSNFVAKIVSDIERDDGVETTREYELVVTLRRETKRFPIAAADFLSLRWVDDKLGAGAVVEPNQNQRLVAAIKAMSSEFVERKVYAHTGWRKIGEDYVYLHSGGAIGPVGPVENVQMDLDAVGLSRYSLPDPTKGDLTAAVRASQSIAGITARPVSMLILGTVYRAPLGAVGHTAYLVGQTGSFKTALSALAAQHSAEHTRGGL